MFAWRCALTWVAVPFLALAAVSCSSRVDIKQSIEVAETSGGWYDAGIVAGKNKIVPGVTFRLRKKADVELDAIALNVVFRRPPAQGANEEEDWDEVYLQNVRFSEGNQTPPLIVRTTNGYTGDPPQSRLDILKHSQFRDIRARIFAKHSASQWVELGTLDVQRQLIVK